jgi:hypothetical protein
LGAGAGYAIFGWRACARGAGDCCAVRRTFANAFGADGYAARHCINGFANMLGRAGRRSITLAMPGTARVTADELSFVATLAAAQSGQNEKLEAHLTWLFAGSYPAEAGEAVTHAASIFYLHGVWVDEPNMDAPSHCAPPRTAPVFYSGTA